MSHAQISSAQASTLPTPQSGWGGTVLRGSAKVLGHVLAWCLGTLFAVVIQAVLSGFAQSAEPVETHSDESSVELTAPVAPTQSETRIEALILDDACVVTE